LELKSINSILEFRKGGSFAEISTSIWKSLYTKIQMSSPKGSLESKSTEIDKDGKNLLEF